MNYTICNVFPNKLLLSGKAPCLSLYMPTHRLIFDLKQDRLVFKNLVKVAKASLEQLYTKKDMNELMLALERMNFDNELWKDSLEGLAIFATLEEMILYRVETTFEPIAIVSDSFHIKPLIQHYQGIEQYIILSLEAESFKLFQGNQYDYQPIEIDDSIDTTLTQVLGGHHTENFQTHGSYAGTGDHSAFHGHGGKSAEVEIDRVKYFRYVDKYVLEEISSKMKYPLILLANKDHHAGFKKISNNPYLLDESIDGTPSQMDIRDIKLAIQVINDARFNVIIEQAIAQYHNLRNEELSSDQLIIVLKALLNSRIETLMIEKDIIIPGRIDVIHQQIIQSDLDNPQTDDLLDDMVQQAYLSGAKVLILNKQDMPSESAVAGILKY